MMNLLEALPPAWTAADQAAENIREVERNTRREAQRSSDMKHLTIVATATFLGGGLAALLVAVEKVALPLILSAATFFLLPVVLGCMSVASNSDHPMQDIFSSIGKGALVATCVGLLGVTILGLVPA